MEDIIAFVVFFSAILIILSRIRVRPLQSSRKAPDRIVTQFMTEMERMQNDLHQALSHIESLEYQRVSLLREREDLHQEIARLSVSEGSPWLPADVCDAMKVLDLSMRPPEMAEIRARWRERILLTHPDTGGNHVDFIKVQNALEVLEKYFAKKS